MAYKFAESIQKGILYLAKSDKDFYLQIINLVKPEYFELPSHQLIFESLCKHYNQYKVLPNDSIILEYARENNSKEVSEYEDELQWINSMDKTSIHDKEYFLDQIERFAKKERLKLAIVKSVELIKEENFSEVEHIIKDAISLSRTINLGQNFFQDIDGRLDRLNAFKREAKFSTPFFKVNDALDGGMNRKELAFVAAVAGLGKSQYLQAQTLTTLMENKKVLYISLEMSEDKVAQRLDCMMACMSQEEIKKDQEKFKSRLDFFKESFPESKLIIKEFPCGTANVNTLRALLNQLKNYEDFTPDLIVLDYLELMRPITEGMPEYQAQERIAQELRGLAAEYNCLIWTATQINRLGARSLVATDADLADSYGKIRTVDFAISLNQTEEERENSTMRIYVMKNRNGKQRFTFRIKVNYCNLRMENLVEEEKIEDTNEE